MTLHFTCPKCGKALFSQDRFAGMAAHCPACQALGRIPRMAPEIPPSVRVPDDPVLIDMERVPGPDSAAAKLRLIAFFPLRAPDAVVGVEAAVVDAHGIPESRPWRHESQLDPVPSGSSGASRSSDATREFRPEPEPIKAPLKPAAPQSKWERTVMIWRRLSMLASACTTTWLMMLTLNKFGEMPGVLVAFNALLIFGLMWNSRQMRYGPSQVFLAAAVSIMICTPINVLLDFPFGYAEMLKPMREQDQTLVNMTDEELTSLLQWGVAIMTFCVGGIVSIPLWVANSKVKTLERMRKPKGRKS